MYSIYRNLHNGMWSILGSDGRVAHYAAGPVEVTDARLVVQPAGNRRVREQRRKNVHAFVRGATFTRPLVDDVPAGMRPITYNPYLYDHFTWKGTGERVDRAARVFLAANGQAYAEEERRCVQCGAVLRPRDAAICIDCLNEMSHR